MRSLSTLFCLVRLAQHKYLLAAHRVVNVACNDNLNESSVPETHRQASPELREQHQKEEQGEEYDGDDDDDDDGGDDHREDREEQQHEPIEQEEEERFDQGHQYD
jgi:hypothetical protein